MSDLHDYCANVKKHIFLQLQQKEHKWKKYVFSLQILDTIILKQS